MKTNNDNTNFQLYGNKGLNIYYKWLKQKTKDNEYYNYELLANMDEFSCYDIMQVRHDNDDYSSTSTSYIEIKTRDVPFYQYEDCVIDAYKVFNLQKLAYATNNRCFLVAIYANEKKLALWEISPEEQYTTITKEVQWHTAAMDGVKKNKEMVSLPLSEAKIYNYQ